MGRKLSDKSWVGGTELNGPNSACEHCAFEHWAGGQGA